MIVDCAVYEDGKRREGSLELSEAYEAGRDNGDGTEGKFVWIGLKEPTAEEFESVAEEFHLHELAVEDAINAHQRPKLELYGDTLFLVLKTAKYIDETEVVETGEILLFVGDGFIVSVRHGDASDLHGVRVQAEERGDLLRCGTSAVLHAIIDRVVDDYEPVIAGIEDDIEEVEVDVFDDDRGAPTQRIYRLKREVVEFHRAAWPLLSPLDALEQGAFVAIPEEMRAYFRDVHDHAQRVDEQVNSQRELLTSVLEANLALVSVSQNEVVKQISSYAAIIAVPTFIASVYGMNFEHMPELGKAWGYPACLGVMAVSILFLVQYFRRINWL
jgi:magnesium transporter